jgi:flagellar assembly protein FliH
MSEKPSDRVETDQVAAEPWLLPEVNGSHLVTPEKSSVSGAGFHRQVSASSKPENPPNTLAATVAMTQSRLDALVRESQQNGYDTGRAEGYEKGYAEGEARAKALGQEQTLDQKNQLAELINSVTLAVATHHEQAQVAVVELIAQIAQQLCYRELQSDNASIAAVVSDAMSALPVGEKNICLQLNPADLAMLQSMPELLKPEWNIVSDAAMQAGGCRISSENSLIDFSASKRLQEIIESSFALHIKPGEMRASASSTFDDHSGSD